MRPFRIAVVGGGIAGLALALAVHRTLPRFEVTVFERSRRPGESGAGLQLGPNAVGLLERLGAGPALRANACLPESLDFLHWADGTRLLRVPVRPGYAQRFGADLLVLRRRDLHKALEWLLPAGTVRLGVRCTGVEESPDGVRVHLAGGTARAEEADLVVGADGLRSTVRVLSQPDAHPVQSGMDAYRGLAPAAPGATPGVRMWLGPDRHLLCYPVDRGRSLNTIALLPSAVADAGPATGGPLTGAVAARAFGGWDPVATGVLRGCPKVWRQPLYDLEPLPHWSTGRTTLVGDAAHAMLPHRAQGACQAVEDAVTLAALLGDADRLGLPEVLRRYEEVRRPRTALLQALSRATGALLSGPDAVDRLARLSPEDLTEQLARVYGHDALARTDPAVLPG
ncbi:FAD-dependent monooxygenase [Streptomyces sp. NPDC004838]